MEAPAAEVHKIRVQEQPNKVVHIPTQETKWTQGVVQEVKNISEVGSFFEAEHATPHAPKPIPNSEALKKVGAERVGAEPELPWSSEDVVYHASTLFEEEGLSAKTRAVSSKGLPRRVFERATRMQRELKKAA